MAGTNPTIGPSSFGFSPQLSLPGASSNSGGDFYAPSSFTDGNFSFASTPSPGLTTALTNTSSMFASIGSGLGNLLSGVTGATSNLLPILIGAGLVWVVLHHKKKH